MMTFYCLMSEFYDNGSVKTAIISRECREKPQNSCRELPFADCYKDWYDTEWAAKQALLQYRKLAPRVTKEGIA